MDLITCDSTCHFLHFLLRFHLSFPSIPLVISFTSTCHFHHFLLHLHLSIPFPPSLPLVISFTSACHLHYFLLDGYYERTGIHSYVCESCILGACSEISSSPISTPAPSSSEHQPTHQFHAGLVVSVGHWSDQFQY